jgi:septum formation protein
VDSELILASRSPQRRAILEQLGIPFTVVEPDAAELEDGAPDEIAAENASRKARAVSERAAGSAVLGVDTVVSLDGTIYGKPADAGDARRTLRALSGRRHAVTSGICLMREGRARTAVSTTDVEFRTLGDELLEWYVRHEEWRGRAGGYAIQGRGAALVARIDGDYLGVVGLPVAVLMELAPWLVPWRGPRSATTR